jgi:hypothetical protein
MKLRNVRERQRLQRLIEEISNKMFRLEARGLALYVEEIETRGRIPQRIQAWANLHFFQRGSPFCCMEPSCHLFVDPTLPHPLGDALRKRLKLQQTIDFGFVHVHPVLHDGLRIDPVLGLARVRHNIDERDELGRTALWRAVVRGDTRQIESLLEAGADPTVPGPGGQTLFDRAPTGDVNDPYTMWLLEQAATTLRK